MSSEEGSAMVATEKPRKVIGKLIGGNVRAMNIDASLKGIQNSVWGKLVEK